jgi:hypothetical protein
VTAPDAIPCYDELAAVLAKSRPDTTEADWRNAMLAATTVGWTWKRIFAECGRIHQQDGDPRDLRNAVSYLPKPRTTTKET